MNSIEMKLSSRFSAFPGDDHIASLIFDSFSDETVSGSPLTCVDPWYPLTLAPSVLNDQIQTCPLSLPGHVAPTLPYDFVHR